MPHRPRVLVASFVAAVLLVAGCGPEAEQTPGDCFAGAPAFLDAVQAAPGVVLLEGGTPISDCLTKDQPAGDLNEVGQALIVAATKLNGEARKRPAGSAAIELGYLLGAADAGAAGTGGVHTDLIRRLNSAARFSRGGDVLGAEFERAFGAGYAAARESG
ncbi:MAG: hypothetical protein E4H22_03310 [Solirubrobacterales bacterium]|nr:MAG: hypothetical protein E4H22_03310 [Solirubrobacterales bacterium]